MKPLGHPAGPEGRSGGRSGARSAERRPERRPEGPAGCPSGFNLFFFALHEYHLGFKIYCQIFVNTTKNFKKVNEIQVTKIKKYAWFILKSCFGDILEKNLALLYLLCYMQQFPFRLSKFENDLIFSVSRLNLKFQIWPRRKKYVDLHAFERVLIGVFVTNRIFFEFALL